MGEIHMKKNSVLLIVVILLFITIPLGLIGCETANERFEKRIFETEYFRCVENEATNSVVILEFTEKGKKQDMIVIPQEINGKRVVAIGGLSTHSMTANSYHLNSPNVKKVYITHNLDSAGSPFNLSVPKDEKIVIVFALKNPRRETINSLRHRLGDSRFVYLDKSVEDDLFRTESVDEYRDTLVNANIRFWSGEEVVWLDYYDSELNLYAEPPKPKSEEGNFVGWYTDEALTEVWNGEYVIPDGQEELNLYAKFER